MKKDNIPEIRMPGFKEEWKHKKFHAVFDYLQNNALPRSALNYESGEIKNIHYGDVLIKFGEYIDVSKETLPYIIDEDSVAKYGNSFLIDGDVVIAVQPKIIWLGNVLKSFLVELRGY